MKSLFFSFTFILVLVNSINAAVIFVDKDASGISNGSSWSNAYTDLKIALAAASLGDELWVAEGTYKPSINDQALSFDIPSGVKVFGGFNGTENIRTQRDWFKNETILSGEIGTPVLIDNSDIIVRIDNASEEVVLDGFVIRDAHKVLSLGVTQSALVINSSACRIGHCIFTNNRGTGASAITVQGDSDAILDNSLFYGNTTVSGGTVRQEAGTSAYNLNVTHCTFSDNVHQNISEEIELQDLHWEIRNSVLWGNINVSEQISGNLNLNFALSNSVIEGLSSIANQVVEIDPAFNSPLYNDFRPSFGTSVEELGSPSYSFSIRDLSGQARVLGANPDAGCYEYKGQRIIHVDPESTASNPDGSTWLNAYPRLLEALEHAVGGDDLWVADGIQYLTDDGDRKKSLVLVGQVDIYGGFQGDETLEEERDWRANECIVSGNIGDLLSPNDDSYKLFYIAPGSDCSIKGITIESALANGTADFYQRGAGVHVGADAFCLIGSCTLQSLSSLQGGCVIENEGNVLFQNSTVTDLGSSNLSENLLHSTASLIVRGCFFKQNQTSGSLISSSGSLMQMNASTFVDNESNAEFIEITAPATDAEVRNCIFSTASEASPELVSTVWPIIFNNSIIDGYELNELLVGVKVFFENPYFLDQDNNDYRLCWASRGYNNGNPAEVQWGQDLNGIPRLGFGQIDFGAFENDLERPVLRVSEYATGANTGLSWTDAFSDLNDALAAATCGTQIWIAEGVYSPDANDRLKTFDVPSNTSLYGGFGGFESALENRNWNEYSTILSGEIGNTNIDTDNSFVILKAAEPGLVEIDGVFIRDAYSTVLGEPAGACVFSNSQVRVRNTRFLSNTGRAFSAIYNLSSSLIVGNSLFAQNHTEVGNTINMSSTGSLSLINCTLSKNTHEASYAGEIGGSIGAVVSLANCIIHGNDNPLAGGVNYDYTVTNCLIEGGFDGGVNILDENPLFVNPLSLNFRLSFPSPAVDAGNDNFVSSTFDIARKTRIQGEAVDLGCYEFSDTCPGDLNGDLVINTGDLTIILGAYTCTVDCIYDLNGDGAVNTGDLQIILAMYSIVCGDN